MSNSLKKILGLFGILILFKIIFGLFIGSPTMFGDEAWYSSMAKSFFDNGNFLIWEEPSHSYMPLYPIILSISYLFNDMVWIYSVMQIINAVISSLVVFPIYLISKEFMSRKKAVVVTGVLAVIPILLTFSPYILSENLFHTLFLFCIYFIYRSFKENSCKWDILAGLFMGFCFLTRVIGILLIPLVAVLFLIKIIKDPKWVYFRNKIILYFVALAVVLPWLIRNIKLLGFGLFNMIGPGNMIEYSQKANSNFDFLSWLNWFLLDFSVVILACGIILFLFAIQAFFNKKNEKLKLFSSIVLLVVLFFVLLTSYFYSDNRPFGRYLAPVYPLVMMLGFIVINKFKISKKAALISVIPVALLMAFASKLVNYPLFTSNNSSLSHVGLLHFLISWQWLFVILFFIVPFIFLILYKAKFNKIAALFFIYFLLVSLVNVSIMYYNSETWDELDQMKIGKWFNEYDPGESVVLFDYRDKNNVQMPDNPKYKFSAKPRAIRIGSFWMNDKRLFKEVDDLSGVDYVITTYDMDLEKIKEFENIKVYKT